MDLRTYSVMAVCNPLLDHISHVSVDFLEKMEAVSNTMNLVEEERFSRLYGEFRGAHVIPGGSSANTLRGIAWLSRSKQVPRPMYYGAVGDDTQGTAYKKLLTDSGVECRLVRKKVRTGSSLVAVTPDSERTMFTYLGASRYLTAADVDLGAIGESSVFFCAGYLWDSPEGAGIIRTAAERAHREKTLVAFDLADPFVVSRYRDDFLEWIPRHVNILFGNRDEFGILLDKKDDDEALVAAAAGFADIVVMKAGAAGAWVAADGDIFHSQGKKVRVKDTTGAGDSFAAGFLHGLLSGRGLKECGDQGNALAAAIVEVDGCDYAGISGLKQ